MNGSPNTGWWRRLLTLAWAGALALVSAALTWAQPLPPQKPPLAPPAAKKEVPEEPRVPVPEYALAILLTFVILTAVCMPSRKS